MKSINKLKKISIALLAVALAASLCSFAFLKFRPAYADERPVTVSANNIFSVSSSNGADVWSHKESGETDVYYTMLVIKETDGAVNYRKHLAYNWFYNDEPLKDETDGEEAEGEENEEDGETEEVTSVFSPKEGFFNMEIGFELGENEKFEFEKFIIAFESQQYNQTEDNKTTNYIIFYPTADGTKLNVLVTDEKDDEKRELSEEDKQTEFAPEHIKIEFTERVKDVYKLTISQGETSVEREFVNVGGTYARYSSSSTTPVTPLSFSAKYPEAEEDGDADIEAPAYARMVLYSLNGQSFKLRSNPSEEDGHYISGTVSDVTPAVLCLDKGLSFIEEGEEITFNYTVIDVLASSPSTTTAYFMLTNEQAKSGDFLANDYAAAYEALKSESSAKKGLFRKVKSDEVQLMIPHVEHYVPAESDLVDGVFDKEDFRVTAAIKVCLKLTDTTSTNGVSTYILLDWYVEDKYLVTVKNGETENKYIAVAKDKVGAKFGYEYDGEDGYDWQEAKDNYQAEVTKAAKEVKAGSKNYFYLPSAESLLKDNVTKYTDLTFSIYYITEGSSSFQSNTGRASSNLSINLTKAGDYLFTVLATDAAGNAMYYLDEEGESVTIEATASNVLKMYKDEDEEGLKDKLPWFRFTVGASEISIEDPGDRDTAYVGTEFSDISFDINGVSYDAKYKLYRFKGELFFADKGYAITYEEFMADKESLFNSHRNWFQNIKALSEMNSEDEDYEIFKDYAWDNSSLSFVPQDANSFYLVICEVSGVKSYMGISASAQVRELKGEDTWLQDNMTSVILLSIAGASLIGIVLLLVIKPKNRGDVDEVFEKSEKNKKKTK